jgi:hypothetical protein
MPEKEQLEQFKQAVEEKNEAAEIAAEEGADNPQGSAVEGDQRELTDPGTTQDTRDVRKKNSGKGQVTADKWNQ